MEEQETKTTRAPAVTIGIGIVCVLLTMALTIRFIWEKTALTLRFGPQMVGFSLAHSYYAPLLLAPFVAVIWLVVAIIVAIHRRVKLHSSSTTLNTLIAVAILTLTVISLPEAFWQRMFITKFANSSKAAELMTTDAAEGYTSTVKAYLDHGVPLESRNREGSTSAYTAAIGGRLDVLKMLASIGANLNATNLYGDSPLDAAIEMKHPDAADYLRSHGAKQIHGSDEQHEAASKIIVERDIESMSQSH